MAIEGGLRDFRCSRDGVDGDRVDTAGAEQAGGSIQKPRTGSQSPGIDIRVVIDIRGMGRDLRVLSRSMLLIVA
jgi:hypothetical protein